MTQSFPTLFSPIEIGGVRLRNRLAHASIMTKLVRDGEPAPELLNYMGARARGGTGMLVTEPLAMTAMDPDPSRIRVWDDSRLAGLQRLAEVVEQADSRLLGQLQHSGRGRHSVGRNDAAVGASALPDDLSWTVPRALQGHEIRQMIDHWATACRRLQRAGFAGVEISAGHGHLFHQFLSAWSNRRDDDYGGDLAGRAKLLTSLLTAIRASCQRPFIIGLKLPGDDGISGSIDLGEARRIASLLGATGEVDYWTFVWGAHAPSLYEHLPDAHGPRHPYLEPIRDLRQANPDIPTGALGYLTDPHECERALTDGTANLVFLGRPLITDPAFGRKAESGHEGQIRYCVSCNSCWRSIIEGSRLRCDNNPLVGQPQEEAPAVQPATPERDVLVVGAGIAGLEAALGCARRGHRVTVVGTSIDVGGRTRVHAQLPGGENLSSIYDYQYLAARQAGVTFRLGERATGALVEELAPDDVILATGASMTPPPWLAAQWRDWIPDLRQLAQDLLPPHQPTNGRLVLVDADHTEMTYDAALLFAQRFTQVVIVTPRERLAGDTSLVNRQGIYQRLHDQGVDIQTCQELVDLAQLDEGKVQLRNVFNGASQYLDDVCAITWATARIPQLELLRPLQQAGFTVHTVGDCRAPRGVMAATHDGYAIAQQI